MRKLVGVGFPGESTRFETLLGEMEVGVPPELSPGHVASLLRNLEASAIVDRGIVIQLELDEQLYVAADEMLLSSAVSNLLHNAVKFSTPEATVRLRTECSDGAVSIHVEDQCGGLQHEHPSELFAPYVKQRESNRKGTGLGLAIAKRAVEAMHGELRVTDQPGQGCTFTLCFPLLAL